MPAKKSFASQIAGYRNNRLAMVKDPTFPIFELGFTTGRDETRDLVLTHLQDKYIHGIDRPQRGSPEAKALLSLATELAELLRGVKA